MAKTVYSLVLSPAVVAAVDGLAAREGLSRSALIDRVLAQHVGLSTPEARHREIGAVVEETMTVFGLRASFTSGGALTMHTALRYKYNPSLRYTLALHESADTLGELRVDLRSQNEALLAYLQVFFDLWGRLEQKHLATPPGKGAYVPEEKRCRRTLRRPAGEAGAEALGGAIAAYVTMLDSCVQTYFANLHDARDALRQTEAAYLAHLARLGLGASL